jgi:hypothetical protein
VEQKMTRAQSIILWCGIVAVLLMTVFPPILKTVPTEGAEGPSYRRMIQHEYYFTKSVKKIFLERLFIEWFIAAVITGGFLYTFRSRRDAP